MLHLIDFIKVLDLANPWKWEMGASMQRFMKPVEEHKNLKTLLLALHQTLNDVFPPDYVIFVNLVQEFVYSGRKDILQRVVDKCEAMFVNRNEFDMFSDMRVIMTRFVLESLVES